VGGLCKPRGRRLVLRRKQRAQSPRSTTGQAMIRLLMDGKDAGQCSRVFLSRKDATIWSDAGTRPATSTVHRCSEFCNSFLRLCLTDVSTCAIFITSRKGRHDGFPEKLRPQTTDSAVSSTAVWRSIRIAPERSTGYLRPVTAAVHSIEEPHFCGRGCVSKGQLVTARR
jgi:hypothetical protein